MTHQLPPATLCLTIMRGQNEQYHQLSQFEGWPLMQVTATENLKLTVNDPKRLLQIPDAVTADYLYQQFGEHGPRKVGITELWEALEAPEPFQPFKWQDLQQYFGTEDMYDSPQHQLTIHGDGHQDRVTLYAALLGQYLHLSASDMKVLLVAASVHDRGRVNDRIDPDHGLRAAFNIDDFKNYIATYQERGLTFTREEVARIQLLCIYHELPFGSIPSNADPHIMHLIQTLQIADAADRYRSPNPTPEVGWWPNPQYFMDFFGNDRAKVDAFLGFAAYFTLSSERERFETHPDDPHNHIEDVIRAKAIEVGMIRPDSGTRRISTEPSA